MDGGLEYLKSLGDSEFDVESFEKAAGVGIEVYFFLISSVSSVQVTEAEIQKGVEEVIQAEKERLLEERCENE